MIARRQAGPQRRWVGLAIVIAIGGTLRLAVFLQDRSLWIDEARLGLNIATRPFGGLIGRLAYDQSAPLLFLWIQKGLVSLGGVNEPTLRCFPLVAGIATVAAVYRIGEVIGGEVTAVLAALLAAISPTLIEFSNENKQYSVEALVTCLLVLAYVAWVDQPRPPRARLLLWAGVFAVWLSAPAVFVLASFVLLGAFRGDEPSPLAGALTRASAWAASFGMAYVLAYSQASANPYLSRYWGPALLVPGAADLWLKARGAAYAVLWSLLAGREIARPNGAGSIAFVLTVTILVVSVILAGVWCARSYRSGLGIWLLTLPLLLAAAASVLGAYPVAPRTFAFAAPLLLLLASLGVAAMLARRSGRLGLAVGAASTAALVLIPAGLAGRDVLQTLPWEDVRPLVQRIRTLRKARDVTYISAGALPTYAFYTTDWRNPDRARLDMFERLGQSGGGAFQNMASRGHPVEVIEGREMRWRGTEGVELFGIPTGIETSAAGRVAVKPDSGWAAHEAGRIRAAMIRGDAWVLLSSMHPSERALAEELQRAGLQVTLYPAGITSLLMHARK